MTTLYAEAGFLHIVHDTSVHNKTAFLKSVHSVSTVLLCNIHIYKPGFQATADILGTNLQLYMSFVYNATQHSFQNK